jgi:predicted pyridoxine 5'-phosphate oxidase superfamily flavin-nucleotide-binding protein
MATVNGEGQPYIQHRGGSKGFLKVLDDRTLGFADFSGNRQYISYGNLEENNKVCLFLMDYPSRTRIKMWGTAKVIEDDPELINKLSISDYKGKSERAFIIRVETWDKNCPQHITPRYTMEEMDELTL